MKILIILFPLMLSSCALIESFFSPEKKVAPPFPQTPNSKLWEGRDVDELITHTEFASMPSSEKITSKGEKITILKEVGLHVSSGGCSHRYGVSQCGSVSFQPVCNHMFTVNGDKISGYITRGECGSETIIHRPLDLLGNFLLTPAERAHIDLYLASVVRECSSNKECTNGRVCSKISTEDKGQCLNLRVVNKSFK